MPAVDWEKISKSLPQPKTYSNDRAPTVEEIRKVVKFPDRRIKPLVYVMASSGIRLGAWNHLRWKDVSPITNNEKTGEITAARLTVYADEGDDQYYTFMTPEAYQALKEWMEFRESCREKITGESWLMRDMWRTVDVVKGRREKGEGVGLATHPKKLSREAIRKILSRALSTQGLRNTTLPEGVNRHEVKEAHGYRKFFKTRAEQEMKPLNVELLMGHKLGLQGSYYKPTEKEVLNDYLKAVPSLTINYDNYDKSALQKQVAELTEKSEEETYIIKGKLAEKVKEFDEMKVRLDLMELGFRTLIETRVMDPFIIRGGSIGAEAGGSSSITDGLSRLVEKRREELRQNEEKRKQEIMNVPFREDE